MREKKQNGDRNVRNFRRFLFGMSPKVSPVKVRVLTNDFTFLKGINKY